MKIERRSQLKVGLYLMKNGRAHEILEILDEKPERWGLPSICIIEHKPNVPQQISFDTAKGYELVDKNENPEYFL